MSKKKRLVSYKLLPAFWGLSGNTLKRAKAEYELDGIDLDIEIANIEYEGKELQRKLLEIDRKYNKIDEETFERAYKKLDFDNETAHEFIDLDADLKYKKITALEYEKKKATMKKEPWVKTTDFNFDTARPIGSTPFTVDWNEYFIEELKEHGYSGPSEWHIVNRWLIDLCVNVTVESGILAEEGGDPTAITSIRHENGTIEYS